MFKKDELQSCFRICLTGCRLFATIKILVMLLVTDLTSIAKNYNFQLNVSSSVLLLTDLTISTKIQDLTKNNLF